MHVSLVIPAYNEEHRLHKNIVKKIGYLDTQSYEYEVIIVDDGSSDHTAHIADELSAQFEMIRVVRYQPNRGKGYAVRVGILEAKGDYIFFTDSDSSTPIEFLEDMLPFLEKRNVDVVIGSRNLEESNREVPQPIWRQMLGKVGNVLIRNFLGIREIRDTQCGFKGFTNKAAKELFSKAVINRWGFDFEILVMAKQHGLHIKEVPVTWMDNEGSRFQMVGGSLTTLVELLQVKYNALLGRYENTNVKDN